MRQCIEFNIDRNSSSVNDVDDDVSDKSDIIVFKNETRLMTLRCKILQRRDDF